MSKRITIDPITRIEGHLRIDVDIDGGKDLHQVGVLAHLHAVGEGNFQNLLGDEAAARSCDPGRRVPRLLFQRHGDGFWNRLILRFVFAHFGSLNRSGRGQALPAGNRRDHVGKNCRKAFKKYLSPTPADPLETRRKPPQILVNKDSSIVKVPRSILPTSAGTPGPV